MFTDYQYAIVYDCVEVLPSGYCAPDQIAVGVWGRNKEEVPKYVLKRLSKAVREICLQGGDFIPVPIEGEFGKP